MLSRAWGHLVCEPSSTDWKLAKLAGREPKRAASLCPAVLLKIAGHGAANESAAVIPVLDGYETPRIKVDSALRNRGYRRRRALRRQQCQLIRIVKQAQARAAPAEPPVNQGDRQALRKLRERLQARGVPIIDGAAAYELLRQVASLRFLPHSEIRQLTSSNSQAPGEPLLGIDGWPSSRKNTSSSA